mmetsp:Transcript_1188/g.1519  ORF Transcript_1188/g.1519 Transcript_1188/m.1519 type:complete len:86 (+) Transcript_1188:417-674(+)
MHASVEKFRFQGLQNRSLSLSANKRSLINISSNPLFVTQVNRGLTNNKDPAEKLDIVDTHKKLQVASISNSCLSIFSACVDFHLH